MSADPDIAERFDAAGVVGVWVLPPKPGESLGAMCVSVGQAAQLLGKTDGTPHGQRRGEDQVRDLIRSGRLRAGHTGNSYDISVEAIRDYLSGATAPRT